MACKCQPVCRCEPAVLKSTAGFRAAIEAAGCSQRALARAADVSAGFVNQLATGRRAGCTAELAETLATHLGVPVEELFTLSQHAGRTG